MDVYINVEHSSRYSYRDRAIVGRYITDAGFGLDEVTVEFKTSTDLADCARSVEGGNARLVKERVVRGLLATRVVDRVLAHVYDSNETLWGPSIAVIAVMTRYYGAIHIISGELVVMSLDTNEPTFLQGPEYEGYLANRSLWEPLPEELRADEDSEYWHWLTEQELVDYLSKQ
jgi:hypothetical protein